MSAIEAWLAAAPPSAVTTMLAILAAVVALLVMVITQLILGRRARTELLTKKLEELYLTLNEVSAHGIVRTDEASQLVSATPFTKPKITGGSIERQGLDLHRKIFMLVRLYFPKLSAAHQAVVQWNREITELIYEAETGPPLSEQRLFQLSVTYRDSVVAMEEELILNRRVLVEDHLLHVQYKRQVSIPTSSLSNS
jgi:hypothetical protein